jgi:hypothetical protein
VKAADRILLADAEDVAETEMRTAMIADVFLTKVLISLRQRCFRIEHGLEKRP